MRHLATKDLKGLNLQARTFFVHARLPEHEGDHEVDAFLAADGTDAEDRGDVNDTDATALHVATVKLLGSTL